MGNRRVTPYVYQRLLRLVLFSFIWVVLSSSLYLVSRRRRRRRGATPDLRQLPFADNYEHLWSRGRARVALCFNPTPTPLCFPLTGVCLYFLQRCEWLWWERCLKAGPVLQVLERRRRGCVEVKASDKWATSGLTHFQLLASWGKSVRDALRFRGRDEKEPLGLVRECNTDWRVLICESWSFFLLDDFTRLILMDTEQSLTFALNTKPSYWAITWSSL